MGSPSSWELVTRLAPCLLSGQAQRPDRSLTRGRKWGRVLPSARGVTP